MKSVMIVMFLYIISTSAQESKDAKITLYENVSDGRGNFKYAYQTDTGIVQEQIGQRKSIGTKDSVVIMRGSFSFVTPDHAIHKVRYTADEDGYRPYFLIVAEEFENSVKTENTNTPKETDAPPPTRNAQPNTILDKPILNQTNITDNDINFTDDRIGTPVIITLQQPG